MRPEEGKERREPRASAALLSLPLLDRTRGRSVPACISDRRQDMKRHVVAQINRLGKTVLAVEEKIDLGAPCARGR
jgi:hypothetical protein